MLQIKPSQYNLIGLSARAVEPNGDSLAACMVVDQDEETFSVSRGMIYSVESVWIPEDELVSLEDWREK